MAIRAHLRAGGQRLVQRHPADAGIAGHLCHAAGLGHVADGALDLLDVAVGQHLADIGGNGFRGVQVFGQVEGFDAEILQCGLIGRARPGGGFLRGFHGCLPAGWPAGFVTLWLRGVVPRLLGREILHRLARAFDVGPLGGLVPAADQQVLDVADAAVLDPVAKAGIDPHLVQAAGQRLRIAEVSGAGALQPPADRRLADRIL